MTTGAVLIYLSTQHLTLTNKSRSKSPGALRRDQFTSSRGLAIRLSFRVIFTLLRRVRPIRKRRIVTLAGCRVIHQRPENISN